MPDAPDGGHAAVAVSGMRVLQAGTRAFALRCSEEGTETHGTFVAGDVTALAPGTDGRTRS